MKKIALSVLIVSVLGLIGVAFAQSGQVTPTVAERWEYKVLSPRQLAGLDRKPTVAELRSEDAKADREQQALDTLNRLGADGWELVEIANDHFYFKRKLGGA